MKKYSLLVLLMSMFIFGGTSYAANELDVVSNDGITIPFEEVDKAEIASEVPEVSGSGAMPEASEIIELPEGAIQNSLDLEFSPEHIIGTDERKIVTNTTVSPYSSVVYLVMTFPNGKSYVGSGSMISSDTVLTAGHCLYKKSLGGWATRVTVYPGNNGNIAPYGKSTGIKLLTVSGWMNSESSEHDIGAIKLDKKIGSSTGWFGMTTNPGTNIALTGYPGEKSGYMYTQQGSVSELSTNNVYYKLDTTGGNSGSAVYNPSKQVVAVHAYGAGTKNFGTRLNNEKYKIAYNWAFNTNPPVPKTGTIKIWGLHEYTAKNWLPIFQKDYVGLVTADRVFGAKNGSTWKARMTGVTYAQAIDICRELRAKYPNYMVDGARINVNDPITQSTPFAVDVSGIANTAGVDTVIRHMRSQYAGIITSDRIFITPLNPGEAMLEIHNIPTGSVESLKNELKTKYKINDSQFR